MPSVTEEKTLQRRVAGFHDQRLDGMLELVIRARGSSVLDIGSNRGMVGFEMAINGATVVHGCDNYREGIEFSRLLFADRRSTASQFEVVDLTEGPAALDPFGKCRYDIVLMLAVYHKIKRQMPPDRLSALMKEIGDRTIKWFAWRATSDKPAENDAEMRQIDQDLAECRLKRVHTSRMSHTLGSCAIWERM